MKKYPLVLLAIFISLNLVGVANATSFHGVAVGSWENVDSQSSDYVSVYNNDKRAAAAFKWGMSITRSNNIFIFDGKGDAFSPEWIAEIGDPFSIGKFSYRNEHTMFASTVNGVDLNIALSLSSPAGLDAEKFLFDFSFLIENTPNTTRDPVLDADIVTITTVSPAAIFNYLGTAYTLEVLGFSTDGGKTTITNFNNPEGMSKRAELYGRISETAPVPEPATILLLGVGLAGIAGFRIKSKKKRS